MNTITAYSHLLTRPRLQPWLLPAWNSTAGALESVTAGYGPISLQQMDAVALLDRTDTKFVMSVEQLLKALATLRPDYRMLSIHGQRLSHYRTLYFDTADFALYHAHVNGRAERYKVRSREYIDSSLSFLEVKHKTRKGRTIKDRIRTDQPVMQITADSGRWLHRVFPLDGGTLEAKLWNTFTRITLVSKQYCERVTLDLDIAFHTEQRTARLNGVAIAEVKMDASGQDSPFLAQMRAQRLRPRGFSKYCMGVSLLYDGVKKNAIKPKALWVEKIAASR
ncbi:MAG: polyphosphate polymerase domain-containing protein [Chloroflexota bacterium]